MTCRYLLRTALGIAFALPAVTLAQSTPVDFAKDVFPIFQRSCVPCHGERMQQGQLRLDARKIVIMQGGQSGPVVVPGKSLESLLYQRMAALNGLGQMPPFGKKLPEPQLAVIRQWIDQGAVWPEGVGADITGIKRHWSYVKPQRPALPAVKDGKWVANAIDRFILARLEKENLPPNPEAPRHTLARRLSFDLRGLPPTPEEVNAFVNDKSPGAYEKLVDRFLASPAYGERWAQFWLDLARYADTNGYESDEPRSMWAWRDWVIEAFNRNLSFDRFTIEQLAGDLIDGPSDEQIVATGFHRNTLINSEAGAKDDEYRDAAIKDRVDTTAAVFLGSTIGCAQCHNHKYDPFTQKDYYSLYAFFNNTAESAIDITETRKVFRGDPQERARREKALEPYRQAYQAQTPQLAAARKLWEQEMAAKLPAFDSAWKQTTPAVAKAKNGAKVAQEPEGWLKVEAVPTERDTLELEIPAAAALTGFRLEGWEPNAVEAESWTPEQRHRHEELVATKTEWGPWHEIGPFNAFSAEEAHSTVYPPEREIDLTKAYENGTARWKARPEWKDGVKQFLVGYNAASYLYRTIAAEKAIPAWVAVGADHGVQVWLNGARLIKTTPLDPLPPEKGLLKLDLKAGKNELLIKYTNAAGYYFAYFQRYEGLERERDLALVKGDNGAFRFSQPLAAGTTLRLKLNYEPKKGRKPERFRVLSTGLATADLAELMRTPPAVLEALHHPGQADQSLLDRQFRSVTPLLAEARRHQAEFDEFLEANSATTMVMRELPEPRETFIQARGNFLTKGDKVQPNTPGVLGTLPAGYPRNRLGLAKWLVSRDNPLTARVTVNHFWRSLFSRGLVATGEDFGKQGDAPTHPELLDWMAVDFMESGWDVKRLLKLIVTSNTYRQDSEVADDKRTRDPGNKLLARGVRVRIPAENVRDTALAVSGLLSKKVGGPSVFPPLPPSVFDNLFVEGGFQSWPTSEGEDRYRRGLYTFTKRGAPYPAMSAFDAPERTVCTVSRPNSNTPLQALTTLNDQAFVEAAGALAQRLVTHEGNTRDKLTYGFRLAVSRDPSEREIVSLLNLHEKAQAKYRDSETDAAKLVAAALRSQAPQRGQSLIAPWIVTANVLLNLDETITKE